MVVIYFGNLFAVFVIIASFGIGCMLQSNSACTSIVQNFNIDVNFVAVIITILGIYFVFSEEKKIAKISSIIIPISTIIYLIMSIMLLYIFKDNIVNSIVNITKSALNIKSGISGVICFGFMRALSTGLSKGMFSNEAGMGSSPIFEVTVNNKNIKEQSIISSISVFIDTTVLCTITGIIFVSSGCYINEYNPFILVQNVFNNLPYGSYLLSFCLTTFAIATIPCWAYYGKQAVKYLFSNRYIYTNIYKIIYVMCIYIGAIINLEFVWNISSIANAFMAIPNLFMIYYLINEIK
ncbi:MAG: alanine:cation symporter family protein [Clostridia bacterium]